MLGTARELFQYQECAVWFHGESLEVSTMLVEEGFNYGCGAVADSNPHYLRRVAKEKAALMKIGVFRDDNEAVLGGILPDVGVVGRTEPNIAHVRGVGVVVREG